MVVEMEGRGMKTSRKRKREMIRKEKRESRRGEREERESPMLAGK